MQTVRGGQNCPRTSKRKRSWFLATNSAAAAVILICALGLPQGVNAAAAAMSTGGYATKFFLETAPTATDLTRIPADARDVIIAKVRIVDISGTRGRHGERYSSQSELYGADVEILDVLRGRMKKGTRLTVFFGSPHSPRKFLYPLKRQRERDYFIAAYIGSTNGRRLVGFPASQEEYQTWMHGLLKSLEK